MFDHANYKKIMQVSYVLPDVFQECSIRLYCNIKNKEKDDIVESITKAFGKWCQEKGYPLPQVGFEKKNHVLFPFKWALQNFMIFNITGLSHLFLFDCMIN
jgi:hypothetical protein